MTAPERQPYGAAALAGLAVLALYVLTLAPTAAFWDASEYIAAAHVLGIPHPPGNPLFVLLAATWSKLLSPTGLPVAIRLNLFSAVMTAGASVFWFLVVYRILAAFTERRAARLVGAASSVAISATAFTVWNQSNVNEKVYTVSLLTIALLSWIGFRWRDSRDRAEASAGAARGGRRGDRLILLMVFVLALTVGNHLMGVLVAPALVMLIVLVAPRVFLEWRLYACGLVIAIAGLSVQMFLPIRAGLDPLVNEAAPVCESLGSAAVSVLSFSKAGCDALSAALVREQFAKPPLTERMAPLSAQLTNYLQYFDWQWARSVGGRETYFAAARLPFTLLFAGLGLLGAWQHARRDRTSFAFLLTLFLTTSVVLVFYLNFRYGYGQAQVLGASPFEARERDYFYLVSFSVWGLWAGIGLTWLWLRLADRLGRLRRPRLAAAPVLAIALLPLTLNWSYATRAGNYAARDVAYNMLQSVEPYGILFTTGDNETFPLWYLQEVEGIRQDVTVIVESYLNTGWYARQIRDLTRPCPAPDAWAAEPTRIVCQRPFETDVAAPLYDSTASPGGSALPLTDPQIDEITRSSSVLPDDVLFEARGIEALIRAGTEIRPADHFTLLMIRNAWGDRPIHFSGGGTPRVLGLEPHLARHGLTYKLVTAAERDALVAMPVERAPELYTSYVDVARTRALLWDDFRYQDRSIRRARVDRAALNPPMLYAFAHAELSAAEQLLGDSVAAQRNKGRADYWLEIANR